ncbi:MAG: AsmA-like C-terminal region-containing protein [Saprospiraceae bacterium]
MKTFVKRFMLVLAILLGVLVLTWLLLASVFREQVGRRIVKEINKQLTSELTVQAFDLSLIRSLPDISADLQGVLLKDNRGGALLEAENLSFRFGLLSLFGSKLKIRSVAANNGALNIQIDRRGRENYTIFKSATETRSLDQEDAEATIDLQKATLTDFEVIYEDHSAGQSIWMNVDNANVNGQFSAQKFSLQSTAELQSSFVEMDSIRYLVGTNLSYDATILVDLEQDIYDLQDVTLSLNDNIFKADGQIELFDQGPAFDLYLDCTQGDVSSLIALLPEQYANALGNLTSDGNFVFKTYIKGQATKELSPQIRAEISLQNGQIESPQTRQPLRDVSFTANFTNGKYRSNESTVFAIQNLKGYFNRELFEMRLLVNDFAKPNIDFAMNGVVPMEIVYGFLNNPKITAGSGEVEIKNLVLKGNYADMIDPQRIAKVQAGGEIEFDDAALTINEEQMLIDQGKLVLHGDTVSVPEFKLTGAGSDILFKGLAINAIPVFFADSTNENKVELIFNAELQSQNLDLDRLIKIAQLTEAQQQQDTLAVDSLKTEQIKERQQFTQFLKGTFNATVQHINYNLIDTRDFRGKLEFNNNQMLVRGRTTAMNGTLDLDGTVYFEAAPRLASRVVCENLSSTEFFRQTENFGQEVLTDQHLSGNLDAQIAIFAYWDTSGNFQYDQLRVLADMNIRDGNLKNFKPLEQFSTYVKIRDLQNIRFAALRNYIEIDNRTIYIPTMFIQSNAMNMTVSGEHTFDNKMDYNMKVNAGQILTNRFKSFDPSLKPQKARSGWLNLYFNIAGTMEDFKVKTSKREVQNAFVFSERRKKAIENALAKQFGNVQKLSEPVEWQDAEYLDEIEGGAGN